MTTNMRGLRDWLADHIGLDEEQKLAVYASVARSATMRDATYWAEIIFAAGIATMGLTLGSPAVIIGAMLISPLMGPIMAAGLALAAGDFILTIRSIANVAVSCVIAVAFATLLVVLLPFREMTSEIASRTQPNTLDLVVALFSGAVAALATSKSLRGVATSIPGVAIAVALMPPLCVTGYGLGVLMTVDRVQGLDVMRGGGLLFLTNLIAIAFSSMLVFLALHIDEPGVRARMREWRAADPGSAAITRLLERLSMPRAMARVGSLPARFVILVTMIAVVAVPLTRSFDALSREIAQRNELNAVQRVATAAWQERFARTPAGEARSYIDVLEASSEEEGRTALTMRVFTSRPLSPDERESYVAGLARSLGRDAQSIVLTLVEIPTSRYEVATRRPDPVPVKPAPFAQQLDALHQRAASTLAGTPLPGGATLVDSAITLRERGTEVTLAYLAPSPISADAQSLIVRDVQSRLGLDVARVVMRWIPRAISIEANGRTLGNDARQQLATLAQQLHEHPQLVATITANDLARIEPVAAILREAGIAEPRLRRAVAEGAEGVSVAVAGE